MSINRRTRRPRTAHSQPRRPNERRLSFPHQLAWAAIGLVLTIGGTFIEASATNFPWQWSEQGVVVIPLRISFQIAAVLFVGCMGGAQAAALSQVVYVLLGLIGLPIFTQGGGPGYIQELTFGYILGFIPGAWICGSLALRAKAQLESLAFSCLCGLAMIHLTGITYLAGLQLLSPIGEGLMALISDIIRYSVYFFPRQLVLVCTVSVLSFCLRRIMFY
ncbi:biotin transporter BioY [Spirulina subsalsa]|uniref:biotin transporter BioY n=1 Tax=Spirulina subsalsa TaxID=54311 RepID=UPI0002FB500A|nr:biotin transporter BioY [Spirulina subsalsa]